MKFDIKNVNAGGQIRKINKDNFSSVASLNPMSALGKVASTKKKPNTFGKGSKTIIEAASISLKKSNALKENKELEPELNANRNEAEKLAAKRNVRRASGRQLLSSLRLETLGQGE